MNLSCIWFKLALRHCFSSPLKAIYFWTRDIYYCINPIGRLTWSNKLNCESIYLRLGSWTLLMCPKLSIPMSKHLVLALLLSIPIIMLKVSVQFVLLKMFSCAESREEWRFCDLYSGHSVFTTELNIKSFSPPTDEYCEFKALGSFIVAVLLEFFVDIVKGITCLFLPYTDEDGVDTSCVSLYLTDLNLGYVEWFPTRDIYSRC